MLKYTNISDIKEVLAPRLAIDDNSGVVVPTIGGQQTVSYRVVERIGYEIEEWMDSHLRLIYEMPLLQEHYILKNIAKKLVISDLMFYYFEGQVQLSGDSNVMASSRLAALDLFQSLFMGTGIVIPGATPTPQNNPNQNQLQARFIPLAGEILKTSIGIEGQDLQLWQTTETPQSYYIGEQNKTDPNVQSYDRSRVKIDFYEDRYTDAGRSYRCP
jgi:hypothetical protein